MSTSKYLSPAAAPTAQTMLSAMLAGTPGIELADVIAAATTAGLLESDDPLVASLVSAGARVADARPRDCTVREFYSSTVEKVAKKKSDEESRGGGTHRTYESYWKVMVHGYPYQRKGVRTRSGDMVGADPVPPEERLYDGLGDKLISEVRYQDLVELVGWCVTRAELDAHQCTVRRERRGRAVRRYDQDGAKANAVGAIRFFFKQALLAKIIGEAEDISQELDKPGKKPSSRRAFTDAEYTELWQTIVSGGDDPALDALIVETVLVTGARREGILNLDRRDVNRARATVWLDEKGGQVDEQPATVDLCDRLLAFAASRGSVNPDDPVFCYKNSKKGRVHRLTDRRFDSLHTRIQTSLPWADRLGVTIHWCRHHAITTVERAASEAVAARFARHREGGVTRRYDKATGEEVCAVVGLMTGTEHPLASGGW